MGKFIVWTAALANQVVAAFDRWRRAHAGRRQRLRAMAQLGALSDLELKDIGVRRSEIYWVVSHGRDAPPANMLGKGRPDLLPNPMQRRPSTDRRTQCGPRIGMVAPFAERSAS
jgi:uncharacterized protein YjiS (DUF1127 family)